MMLAGYLILLILLVTIVLFLRNEGKFDKKTLTYIAVFSIVAVAVGVGMWLLYEELQLNILYIFLVGLTLFLISGLIHLNTMYKLLWAKRDSYSSQKDSFVEEAAFSFGLASLMVILSLGPFAYLTRKMEVAVSMYSFFLAFPLPFIIAKSFDFLSQIPGKEFDKKWVYEIFPFDETQWKRDNMMSIRFIVADSIANENKWFNKKARFSIVIPRDQELRLIFRLALREYHKKKPSVPVQELGYEENVEPFWWLFKVKFVPWKLSTWGRDPKYLDPTETLASNNLKNGDFIRAKRIMLNHYD